MENPLNKLLEELEAIAMYYKIHGKEGDYADIREALDRYYRNTKK